MPKPKLSPSKKKQGTLNNRYRRSNSKGYKNQRYWSFDPSGRLRTKRDKTGRTHEQAAIRAHYNDYLKRPHTVRADPNKPAVNYGKGGLGPHKVFGIEMHGEWVATLRGGGPKDKLILRTMIRELKQCYRRIVKEIEIEVVGDPRTFGGWKGLVPRGGSGYMRHMTRGFLQEQLMLMNQTASKPPFSFVLKFAIPVDYARPLNERSKKGKARVTHENERAWRITDYQQTGLGTLKPQYKKVLLNDPEAAPDFYSKCMYVSMLIAAYDFKRLALRWAARYNDYLRTKKDMDGYSMELDRSSFIISPPSFSDMVRF